MNLSANDWGLIYDAISWELELLPLHQRRPPSPRMIRLLEIQLEIDRYLNGPADDN